MSAVPHPLRERGIDLLAGLVGFPSVSLSPNGDIVGYIEEGLARTASPAGGTRMRTARGSIFWRGSGRRRQAASCCPAIWMWCLPMPLAGRATRSAFAARTGGSTGAGLSI